MNKIEEDLMDLLDITLLLIMLVEKLEDFNGDSKFKSKNSFNKMLIKQSLKKSLQVITPVAESNYKILFDKDEKTSQRLISEYESFISQIRDLKIPDKVLVSQMLQAFSIDSKTIEATIHRVLKKGK